jgi:hypothetical protein
LLTLNEIHAQIVALANAHHQIAEVGMGTIAELQGKPDRLYPLLWLSNEGGSLEDNYKVDNIRLTMFGRVIVGEEGQDDDASEIEVLSDMQLILLDFLNYFHQQHGQEYVTDKAATLEHFTERTNDRTAGYSCVLELKQFYDWNKCNIPQSGAVIPPTIDGLTLYDFCDQSVIDRLTATQVACLEAELCGTCADATVQLNSTTIGTIASGTTDSFAVNLDGSPSGVWDGTAWQVTSTPCADATVELNGVEMVDIPSGDTENISIRQSSGATEVGSKQGVHWRIDDSAISINGSPVADVKAEDPLDIDVTQDGSPVGSWNGSAWIVPPCDPVAFSINGTPAETLPSGVPFNLIATLNGIAGGTYTPATDTLAFTAAPPTITISASNTSPSFNDDITLTATVTGMTVDTYTLEAPNKDGELVESAPQASNVFTVPALNIGADHYRIIATDSLGNEITSSVEITTTVDLPVVNAKAVFGYYKMIPSYTGYWCNVRRFSDNATLDIPYVNGIGDIDAIYSFAGATGWAVTKVYNQVGNGDLVQTNANRQPTLNDDRSISNISTDPNYKLDLTYTSGFALGQTSTDHFVIISHSAATANSRILTGLPTNTRTVGIGPSGTNIPFLFANGSVVTYGTAIDIQKRNRITSEFKNNSMKSWVNGILDINNTSSTFTIAATTGMEYFNQGGGFPLVKGADLYTHVSYANDRIVEVDDILELLYGA